MTEKQNKIDLCVERLCSQGCDRAFAYLEALRSDQAFPEVAGLSREERQQVLEYLQSIMAVYDS